jgi:small ligand-binding sensory domain FIST
MRIGSALSTAPDSMEAGREALETALAALGGASPGLTVVFHSTHHLPQVEEISKAVWSEVGPGAVIGCTSQAVVGDGREVEDGPALSVWTADLGDAAIEPFAIAVAETGDGPTTLGLPAVGDDTKAVILLGDPYTFPTDALAQLNEAAAQDLGVPVIGGMASGGRGPGQHALMLNGEVRRFGAVGVTLSGPVRIETLVSQGCKPIGSSYIVTGAEGNVITSLGGEPPLERLKDLLTELSPEDRMRVNTGLHLGLVIDEYRSEFGPGDFLIRSVMGADQNTGAIAVGDRVRVGQTVQFHIRDASAADEDLRHALQVMELSHTGDPASLAGALLFTCNGRGLRLFGAPDHDVATIRKSIGPLPVAGMFCAGEIGPVGGQNFLHGFTASLALFRAPAGTADSG